MSHIKDELYYESWRHALVLTRLCLKTLLCVMLDDRLCVVAHNW